jgi:hypothetical protein
MGMLLQPWTLSLLLLGLTALLAISPIGHVVATVAAISVIGLPIALVIAAIPSLFLLLLALRLAIVAWQGLRDRRLAIGVAAAVALLAMTDFFILRAWRVNSWLDARAAELVAADTDILSAPFQGQSLAIIRNRFSATAQREACDDLCRRLLLSGAVRKVVVVTVAPSPRPRGAAGRNAATEWPDWSPARETPGMAWWLEARPPCQDPGFGRHEAPIALPAATRPPAPAVPTDQLMRLTMAQGICLVGEPTALASADAVVAFGPLRSGVSSFSSRSEAWADTVSAWRISVWTQQGGAFAVQYRHTGVAYERLPGAFIPTIVGGAQLQTVNGWVKSAVQINRGRFDSEPPIGAFLVNRLGLDVQPRARREPPTDGEAAAERQTPYGMRPEQAEVVDRVLRDGTAPSAVAAQVLADYLGGLHQGLAARHAALDQADVERIVQIARATRIELPTPFRSAVALAVKAQPSAAPMLAAALFARLERWDLVSAQRSADAGPHAQMSTLAGSLAELPGSALAPHRALVVTLMRNREARKPALALLRRLDGFGPEFAPEIFAMMDDAVVLREARGRGVDHLSRDWAAVWSAGAVSICRLAPSLPPSALEPLRLRAAALATQGLRVAHEVVTAAMLRMGASDTDVMATLAVDPADPKAVRNFASTLRRGQRGEPCQ